MRRRGLACVLNWVGMGAEVKAWCRCLSGGGTRSASGIRGGQAYGATDEFGFRAVDKPTTVHDVHATILHLLGMGHERFTFAMPAETSD